MVSSGKLRRVALVTTNVSEELSASFIRVTRIGEVETTILVTLMKEALSFSEKSDLTRAERVTSQKMTLFIVTAVETSNLT
jgi:hypothetical protein